jgi:hypothetical protein
MFGQFLLNKNKMIQCSTVLHSDSAAADSGQLNTPRVTTDDAWIPWPAGRLWDVAVFASRERNAETGDDLGASLANKFQESWTRSHRARARVRRRRGSISPAADWSCTRVRRHAPTVHPARISCWIGSTYACRCRCNHPCAPTHSSRCHSYLYLSEYNCRRTL